MAAEAYVIILTTNQTNVLMLTYLCSTGVFFYVYPGIAATASFTLSEENPAFGSLLQVGLAFGFGIAFAIITCGSTSGG
jgi:glycerol uptake facilitator-like aquaporin